MKRFIPSVFAIEYARAIVPWGAVAAVLLAGQANAQLKVGSNPTVINTNTNLEVEATDGTRTRVNKDNGNVGIGTIAAPSNKLHVNGTNPLRLEGLQPSVASTDLYLVTDANGVVKSTGSVATLKGTLNAAYTLKGTTQIGVAPGVEVDVPGLTQTFTTTGNTLAVINVAGYVRLTPPTNNGRGGFSLFIDGTKVTTGYAATSDPTNGTGGLQWEPKPTPFTWQVNLAPGTHTIKVRYDNWYGGAGSAADQVQILNFDVVAAGMANTSGVDADAMKSRLSIMVFNN